MREGRALRRTLTIFALIVGVSLGDRTPAAPSPGSAGPSVRMTVVGDSLALGTGATDPANAFAFRVYRAVLATRPGSEVTNLAIGGSRVVDVTRLQVAQVDPRTDLVLVVVGGNDVVRRTPLAQFGSAYARLLAALRARAPRATIVACGVPDVARSPLFADTFAKTEALARADDAAVRRIARASGAAFVDLFTLTRARGINADFFASDDFHPSDAGYALLASVTEPVVERALARAATGRRVMTKR
jgi:lysophospholipase L1-like esterase